MSSSPLRNDGAHPLLWTLGPLDDAGREETSAGLPRFPELAELRHRALGPERLLDRYAAELQAEAQKMGHDVAWKTYALSRLYVAWSNVAPATSKERRATARALSDRRTTIAKTAELLKKELGKNQHLSPKEIEAGIRAFPVTVRFPGLLPMLDEVVAWAGRDKAKPVIVDNAPPTVRFRDAIVEVLGFEPGWTCMADLWNLFANDSANKMTADNLRIACGRFDQKRTKPA